ncbi:MAG: hypothetical protein LBF75_00265 [Treponema sp.]|jgi:hypothetical protein|nr:hypothetical protein [Treponema sp.]
MKYYKKINNGNKIVNEIESYYEINNIYPNDTNWAIIESIYKKTILKNKEFDESTQPYYQNNDGGYILYYVFGFDEPYLVYSNKNKKWKYDFNGP